LGRTGTVSTITGLLLQPRKMTNDKYGAIGEGNPKYSEKTCPSAVLFIKNPT
jgi:hypothetical protein